MLFRTAKYLAVVHETRRRSLAYVSVAALSLSLFPWFSFGFLPAHTAHHEVTVRKYEVPPLSRLLRLLSREFITAIFPYPARARMNVFG